MYLPWARGEARKTDGQLEPESALGDASFSALRDEAMLEAILIYQGINGGWHGDIVLKDMPRGMPNVLGSPVGEPHRTRHQAEKSVRLLLVGLLRKIAENQASGEPPKSAVFLYYGHPFKLSHEAFKMIDRMKWVQSEEDALRRIEDVTTRLLPNGATREAWEALAQPQRAQVMMAIHLAAATGISRYPVLPHRPPAARH